MTTKSATLDPDQSSTSGSRLAGYLAVRRGPFMAALGLMIVTAVWQAIIWIFDVPIYLVPGPADVWRAMLQDYALLLSNARVTIIQAFLGFLLGNTVAILIAILFVYNKIFEELFYPVAILIKTIPIVAVAPVLKIMLGNGMEPKIVVAALICFFPTLVNTVRGLQAVNPQLLELMHVLSASKTEVFRRIRFYSALPFLFSALKISVTMCVLGAIVGEWIGANEGLGYLLLQAMYDFNTPRLFATIGVASLAAIIGFALVTMLEKRVIHWDPGVSV